MSRPTKAEISKVDGAKIALVLCGYGPYADCQSIRHRLHDARAHLKKLRRLVRECHELLESGDEVVVGWKKAIPIWEFAIQEGENLLRTAIARPE